MWKVDRGRSRGGAGGLEERGNKIKEGGGGGGRERAAPLLTAPARKANQRAGRMGAKVRD